MDDRLRFHPLVESDLRDAIGWYDAIAVDLGNRFRRTFDSRLDEIAHRPESFPCTFDDTRFARILRFPHIILFRVRKGTIEVLGVFHSASNPEKWRRRLQ